jgi:hypothetical protein
MAIVDARRLDIAVLAIADGTGTGQRGSAAGGDRRIGDLVMPGGNLLLGSRFLDTDPTGMSARFSVPPVPGPSGRRSSRSAPGRATPAGPHSVRANGRRSSNTCSGTAGGIGRGAGDPRAPVAS